MNSFWKSLVCCAAILPLASGYAQEMDAAKRAAIKDLLDTMQSERKIDDFGETLQQEARQATPLVLQQALVENKKLTIDQKKAVVEKLKQGTVEKLANQAGKAYTGPAFKKDALKALYDVYAKMYSIEEIKDLNTFFKSPTGQKFNVTQVRVDQEVVSTVMEKYYPQVGKAIRDAADKEIAAAAK